MKLLFLDIDGVLNNHQRYANGYCGIDPKLVASLDAIVAQANCRIVIASAWRYMILESSMDFEGFGNVLMIHGADRKTAAAIIGCLNLDIEDDKHNRGRLVLEWLKQRHPSRVVYKGRSESYPAVEAVFESICVLDDLDLGYTSAGLPLVRTDGSVGLTPENVRQVVTVLNTKKWGGK